MLYTQNNSSKKQQEEDEYAETITMIEYFASTKQFFWFSLVLMDNCWPMRCLGKSGAALEDRFPPRAPPRSSRAISSNYIIIGITTIISSIPSNYIMFGITTIIHCVRHEMHILNHIFFRFQS